MSTEYELRALISTRSTLKWFVVIGIIIVVIGVFFLWFLFPFIGVVLLWGGFAISSLSLISLLYLWLSEKIFPQPKH